MDGIATNKGGGGVVYPLSVIIIFLTAVILVMSGCSPKAIHCDNGGAL